MEEYLPRDYNLRRAFFEGFSPYCTSLLFYMIYFMITVFMIPLQHINGSKVIFEDGTEEEYDVIIKCTGYIHKFDFLPARYSEMGGNVLVPLGLYKQCIAMDNSKLW
jgi:hypothetical protein